MERSRDVSSEKKEEDLTLQERMHLSLNSFNRLDRYSKAVIVGALIALVVGLIIAIPFDYAVSKYGTIENLENCIDSNDVLIGDICYKFIPKPDIGFPSELIAILYGELATVVGFIVLSMMVLLGMIAWFLVKGRKIKKEMKDVKAEYIRSSYYFWFQTSIPKGENNLEKFMNLAIEVFPELKEAKLKAQKKKKEWNIQKTKRQYKNYVFDIAIKTSEGYFLVKNFENIINIEDVKKMLKITSQFYKDKEVFRLVCLAKKYEGLFDTDGDPTDKAIELSDKKYNFRYDLIILEENNFNTLVLG